MVAVTLIGIVTVTEIVTEIAIGTVTGIVTETATETATETVVVTEIVIGTAKEEEIEIVTETEIAKMSENGKRTVAAEDLKPDHLPRLVTIADAGNKKIFRNRSSKYETSSCYWMRKRKTVGVQSLPFYFCSRIFII